MAGPSEAGSERPQLSPRRNHKPILSTQNQNGGTVNCFHVHTSHFGNILLWPEVAHPDPAVALCSWDTLWLWELQSWQKLDAWVWYTHL